MDYESAKRGCHVRSGIYRKAKPCLIFWKNHTVPFDERVVLQEDRLATDWYEYDPREHEECSAFDEMPA